MISATLAKLKSAETPDEKAIKEAEERVKDVKHVDQRSLPNWKRLANC